MSGTEKLPPRWFWGSIPSPSVASLTSSLPQHYTVAPPWKHRIIFFRVSSLRRVQVSKQQANKRKAKPPLPLKPSIFFCYYWTFWSGSLSLVFGPFFFFCRFAVTVLGEKKAKQISILPPERAKRTSKRPSVASFCVAKGTEPKGSLPTGAAVPLFTGAGAFWCNQGKKKKKKGFSLKRSCSR